MAIEFGSPEAQAIVARDRALSESAPEETEDKVRTTVSVNGREIGDLDALVANPTEELKDAFRQLVGRGVDVPAWEDDDNMPLNGKPIPAAKVEMAVPQGFDYSQVDEGVRDEVREAATTIRKYGISFRASTIAIGKRLIEVKGMLPHGQFGEWLAAEFSMSDRTARNFMNVARTYEHKTEILPFLSDTVLYMLAAPSTADEARAEVEQAAASGQKVTVEFAKEAVRKAKPEPKTPLATLENMIYEWACNHAVATNFSHDEVLRFVAEGTTTRADKERKRMATRLAELGCTWSEGVLERAASRVWERRQRELRQGQAKAVYVEPEVVMPHPDPVVAVLASANPHGDDFIEVFKAATLEQLIAAQEWLRAAHGPYGKGGYIESTRWNMIGHRRGDLEHPAPVPTPDPEEAAAIAEVAAEREQEEDERIAKDGAAVIATAQPTMPSDLAALGFYFRKANATQWVIVRDEEPEPFESNWCFDPADCVEDVRELLSGNREMAGDQWIANALAESNPTNLDFMSAIKMATGKEVEEALASLSTEDKHWEARAAALRVRMDELELGSIADKAFPSKEEFATMEGAVERSITPEAAAAMSESAERSRRVREDVDLSPVAPLDAELLSQIHPNPVVAALIDPATSVTTLDTGGLYWAVDEATATQLNEALVLMPDALRVGRGPVLETALKERGGVKAMMAEKRRDAEIDPRLVTAKAMIAALVDVRQQARAHYGELTGRDSDLLCFERSVGRMLEPLQSLIVILEKGMNA